MGARFSNSRLAGNGRGKLPREILGQSRPEASNLLRKIGAMVISSGKTMARSRLRRSLFTSLPHLNSKARSRATGSSASICCSTARRAPALRGRFLDNRRWVSLALQVVECTLSVWQRVGEIVGSFAQRTGLPASFADLLDP